ncbi:MAG TPA: DUF3592 domain-containing protein [Terracidiphilus sp.]|nr:DUF3592 domain-containing protein [Terracidiphilus sp.]
MSITFRTSFKVETRQTPLAPRSPGVRLMAGIVLLAMAATLLWLDRGFADYTVTGLFWDQAQGTVVDARNNAVPTIEFSTPDGATHGFKEDYILLCGGSRRFCVIRDFTLGEQVPVVYKPRDPSRAYVHDWALYASVLGFFVDLVATLLLLLLLFLAVRRKPIEASIQFGGSEIDS